MEAGGERIVVTAAHCLRKLPQCTAAAYLEERTKKLLAPLGGAPAVWAECLFADPVADLAVLGCPNNHAMLQQAETYKELINSAGAPLRIADAPGEKDRAWLLSLK